MAGNVLDQHLPVRLCFADLVFSQVKVLDALAGKCRRPIDAGLVIVEDRRALDGVFYGEVFCSIFEREELFYAFICRDDLCFGGALRCLLLADTFPRQRTAAA